MRKFYDIWPQHRVGGVTAVAYLPFNRERLGIRLMILLPIVHVETSLQRQYSLSLSVEKYFASELNELMEYFST